MHPKTRRKSISCLTWKTQQILSPGSVFMFGYNCDKNLKRASRKSPDSVFFQVWNPAFDVTPAELITAWVILNNPT